MRGLAARLAKIETADERACPLCNGQRITLRWIGVAAGDTGASTRAEDYPPETCAGCGRPFTRYLVSWRSGSTGQGAA